jgi:hypothetical protein
MSTAGSRNGRKAARDGAGWYSCFVRFDALLAGEPMSEADSLKVWPEVHERYAEEFGVDPELGRKAIAATLKSMGASGTG